jgi:uncharacterized protein (DUF58 family)
MSWQGLRDPSRTEPARLEGELERLSKGLRLRLSAMADSLLQGESPSSIPGRGVEVVGVREYQPGDEVRGIDWRVTARRGRLYVREYAEERELPVLVLVHRSPTLWAGRGGIKAGRAFEAAALFSILGLRAGDAVGLLLSGDQGIGIVPPGNGRHQLGRILLGLLSHDRVGSPHSMDPCLDMARVLVRHRARVFVVGDFQLPSTEMGPLQRGLRILSQRHVVVPVRITDEEEGNWPLRGSFHLQDPVSGRSAAFLGPRTRQALRRSLAETEGETRAIFRSLGLQEWVLDVKEPLVDAFRRHLFRARGRLDPGASPSGHVQESGDG